MLSRYGSDDTQEAAWRALLDDLVARGHGHRQRRITGSFGTVEIAVPGRASPETRVPNVGVKVTLQEWSQSLS